MTQDAFDPKKREAARRRRMMGDETEYSPEYQDEYQRLWHEAAAERDKLQRTLAEVTANAVARVSELEAEREAWAKSAAAKDVEVYELMAERDAVRAVLKFLALAAAPFAGADDSLGRAIDNASELLPQEQKP